MLLVSACFQEHVIMNILKLHFQRDPIFVKKFLISKVLSKLSANNVLNSKTFFDNESMAKWYGSRVCLQGLQTKEHEARKPKAQQKVAVLEWNVLKRYDMEIQKIFLIFRL